MSGKRAFLDLLKQEGVEVMFGNPGTTELPLMDAFATENELRYLLGLQEAAVMAMADGYAQASGKLAVVNLHVAPGLGNAMGMLYDAQKAGSPILVTAGQHEQSFNATEPILWADLPTIARPLVKWSSEVHRLADLPRLVHRAAKTALAPPTGPVFLSLPGDILRADGDIDLSAPSRVAPRLRGDRAAVEAAAALLAEATHPVIMAGDAVARRRARALHGGNQGHRQRARGARGESPRAGASNAGATAGAAARDRADAAEGCGRHRGGPLLGARYPAAHPQRRPAELFRLARRRHRLGAACRDRRQARLARSAGARSHRRWQRPLYLPRTVDCRALPHWRRLRDPQQQL